MGMVTFHIYENCHNFRIGSDTDTILRSETGQNKRYTATSQKSDTDVIIEIYDFIVNLLCF